MLFRRLPVESLRFLVCFIVWLALFVLVFILKRQSSPAQIIYYEGGGVVIAVMFVGLVIGALLLKSRRWASLLSASSLFASCVAYLFAAQLFVTTIALLERSISIFVIAITAQSQSVGLSRNEIDQAFQQSYVAGTGAIEKRLQEQLATGNARSDGGRYSATPRGRFVYDTNRFLAALFNIPRDCVEPGR